MSQSARTVMASRGSGPPAAGPALAWGAAALALALLEAAAVYVDPTLGVAVAIGVAGLLCVLLRPARLVPIALVTVLVEGMTFGGVAVTRLLAPVALALLALELLRGAARVRIAAPLLWAGAYVAWACASGLWTVSPEGLRFSVQSLAIALTFMLVFAALLSSERDLRRLLLVLAGVCSLAGALSVAAFAGAPGEIGGLALLQQGRSQGFVGDPDFFAAMQLVAIPLILVLADHTPSPAIRLALFGALLATAASVFTSLSRGAFLAGIVLALALLASRAEALFASRRHKAVALLVASVGIVAFFSFPYARTQVADRAATIYAPQDQDDATGAGRTDLWRAAWRTASEHPLLGIGAGSFNYVSQDLLLRTPGVDGSQLHDRAEGENLVAHNLYLGTTAELGLIGLLLYGGLMISTAVALWRTALRARAAGADFVARVAHALLIGLASWAVTSIFLSTEATRMFWVIVGLSLALPKLLGEDSVLAGGRAVTPGQDGAAQRQA